MKKNIFSTTFLLFLALAGIVSAATLTIRPDAQGTRAGWTAVGCSGGDWKCISEIAANTTDYLKATGTAKETFTFSDASLGSLAVNSVTMHYYAMDNGAANACFAAMVRSGGTDYLSGTQQCGSASWADKNYTYTTNPATGIAWTGANVDALEAGMYGLNPNGGGKVAQVYAVVDYNSCGDNVINGDDVCDGTALGGQTCTSQGYAGGTLHCNANCQGYDVSSCTTNSCSDTDGGIVPTTQGIVSGFLNLTAYNDTDSCLTNTTLLEFYCSGSAESSTVLDCATNMTSVCVNGRCV